MPYPDLATAILKPYVNGVFSDEVLGNICLDAYNFPILLEKVDEHRHIMRLDQGPTASFKDFAARFMGRALGRLVRERNRQILILTATSGDTGSAVANAFLGVDGIKVVVIFPINEVSNRQRKQMTTLGDNVSTVAVHGKFDDCQALVKQAFSDPDLASYDLSSANSINIGRLLPQSVYYVYAASRLADVAGGEKVIFSVPSGNFGDMMGGILAFHTGLPVAKYIIATNSNDEVPKFFETGKYEKVVPSKLCISNAMNVGHPSNLARLIDLYGGRMDEQGNLHKAPDMHRMKQDIFPVSITDEETRDTIGAAYKEHNLMLEPHGSVGWAGLLRYLKTAPEDKNITAICLETAHPAKFPDEIRAITGIEPPLPPSLEGLEDSEERYQELEGNYEGFKAFLQREYGK
jgi:threonine synthase